MSNIDFAKTFGQRMGMQSASTEEKPKPKVYINIGYETDRKDNYSFVSLPFGIGLDTMEPLPVRGRNDEYNNFTRARNALLKQMQEAAASLKPGEEAIIGLEGGLALQIRRVEDAEPETEASMENNPFAPPMTFKFT